MRTWPLVLIAAQFADATTTYLNLPNFPWMAEGNRLTAAVIGLGWPSFFALKGLVAVFGVLVIVKIISPKDRPLVGLIGGLIALAPAVWNVSIMLYSLWVVASLGLRWVNP